MWIKKTVAAAVVVFALPSLALAVGEEFTAGTPAPTQTPKPIIVATVCPEWVLIGADVDYSSTDGMDKYSFIGNCNINVDQTGQNPNIVNLPFKLEAEWFDKMKRASEKVTVLSAQYGVTFTTWATCNRDPFPDGSAACHSPGMGAHKWSLYIDQSQAPFAWGRTSKAAAEAKSPKKTLVIPRNLPMGTIAPRIGLMTPAPRATGTGTATPAPTNNANAQAPTILKPTQNQVLSGGAPMTIKLAAAPGANVNLYDVEGQKKVGGVWQGWFNLTYNMSANPNGMSQQTGTQNPERRLRAKAQGVPGAQWSGWVNFTLQ